MKKKMLTWTMILGALALSITGTTVVKGYSAASSTQSAMPADGYVLSVVNEDSTAEVVSLNFSQGTKITKKFPSSFRYNDIAGEKTVVDNTTYLHYTDGSISALKEGILVDPSMVNDSIVDFFSIGEKMVLTSTGSGYTIDNNADTIAFMELLWLVEDNKMLAASDQLSLYLSNGEKQTASGFVEITYLDDGIVQLVADGFVWTGLSSTASIEFASGTILNLGDKTLYNNQRNPCFTTDSMAMELDDDSSTIHINSDSDIKWEPPTFSITAQNGEDGENGTEGESGEIGSTGENGEQGQDGRTGSRGNAGGTPSATGGNQGGGQTQQNDTMGLIRVLTLSNDVSSARFTLGVDDDSGTLTSNTGEVEIREAGSNRLVWSYSQSTGANLDIPTLASGTVLHADSGLNANTEYILIVRNGYSLRTQAGTTTGTKTFVTRRFFTSTEGVTFSRVENQRQDAATGTNMGINVTLTRQDFSDARSAMVRLWIGDKFYDIDPVNFSGLTNQSEDSNITIDLTDSRLLMRFDIDPASITALSDTEYKLELFTSKDPASSGAFIFDSATNDFQGDVVKSSQVYTGRTFKETPVFGNLLTVNSNQGYYQLVQEVESDKDNAIVKHQFIITNTTYPEDEPTVIESTNGNAVWYFTKDGSYSILSRVIWNDNEKVIEQDIATSNVLISMQGIAVISFEEHQKSDTSTSWNKHLFNESKLWGELIINTNGALIKESSLLTITVTSDANTYYNIITYPAPATIGTEQEIRIPLQLPGLTEGSIYTLTVSGTVGHAVNIGTGTQINYADETIGRTFYRTKNYTHPTSEDDTIAAFDIVSSVNNGNVAIVQLTTEGAGSAMNDYTKFNSTAPTSKYFVERAAASAIEFTVFSSQGVKIGTFVKSLYTPVNYNPDFPIVHDGDRDVEYTRAATNEYREFFDGPLVNSMFVADSKIYITEQDLKSAGVTDTSAGIVGIQATALYDYGYHLKEESIPYQGLFISGTEKTYNSYPLTKVSIYNHGVATGRFLNYTTVDLGTRPPVLPTIEEANKQITATPITYGNPTTTSILSATNATMYDKYPAGATLGYRLHPNYENSNGDINSLTYYAFTKDTYATFRTEDYGGNSDPIEYYLKMMDSPTRLTSETEDNIRAESNVKWAVTLSGSSISKGPLPDLYVMVDTANSTETSGKWKEYWEEVTEGGYKNWKANPKETATGNGTWVVYVPSDWMEKGFDYVFAYTFESFYGVSGTGDAWTYPYDITPYNSTQQYMGFAQLPRSGDNDFLKVEPTIASVLVYTKDVPEGAARRIESKWRYFLYDPDHAITWRGGVAGQYVPIATTDTYYENYSRNFIKGTMTGTGSLPVLQLSATQAATARTLTRFKGSSEAYGLTYNVGDLFGSANAGWSPDDIMVFDLVVTDSTEMSIRGLDYSVWFQKDIFKGQYSAQSGSQTFKAWAEQSGTLGYDYFFKKTVSQHPQTVTPEEMQAVKFNLSMYGETEKVIVDTLDIRNNSLAEQINRIAAIEYEIFEDVGGSVGTKLQSGTVVYNAATHQAEINMTFVPQNKKVFMKIAPVYDSGISLGLAISTGTIINPNILGDEGKPTISVYTDPDNPANVDVNMAVKGTYAYAPDTTHQYFSVQSTKSNNYGRQLTLGSDQRDRMILFNGQSVAGGMYKVSPKSQAGTANTYGEGFRAYSVQSVLNTVNYRINNLPVAFKDDGMYDIHYGTDPFVFKLLKQTTATTLADNTTDPTKPVYAVTKDGIAYFQFVASSRKPSIIERSFPITRGTDRTLAVTVTDSSYEMINNPDQYDGNIYFEVFESLESTSMHGSALPVIVFTPYDDFEQNIGNSNADKNMYKEITLDGSTQGGSEKISRLFDSAKYQYIGSDKIGFVAKQREGSSRTASGVSCTHIDGKGYNYQVEMNNLNPGHKYYVRMYVMKNMGGGTYDKEYFLDASLPNAALTDFYKPGRTTNEVCLNFTMGSTISEGPIASLMGSDDFTTEYKAVDYNLEKIIAKYSATPIGYTSITPHFVIKNSSGVEVVSEANLMKLLGYERIPGRKAYFWNYENGVYEYVDDYRYYSTDDPTKVYTTTTGANTLEFIWNSTNNELVKDLIDGNKYNMELSFTYNNPFATSHYDETTNTEHHGTPIDMHIYKRGTDVYTVAQVDTYKFDVPKKAKPALNQTTVSVTSSGVSDTLLNAKLNLMVSDLSYQLGGMFETTGGTGKTLGQFGLRIKRLDTDTYVDVISVDGGTPTTVPINPSAALSDTMVKLTTNRRYTVDFQMAVGVQYVVEVWGVTVDPADVLNKCIIDSTSVTRLHSNLLVSSADAPRIEDSRVEFDEGLSFYGITVYNAVNIDKINTIRLTVTGYHPGDGTEWTQSYTSIINFAAGPSVGGRTTHNISVNLQEIMKLYASPNDSLTITAYLYGGNVLYIDSIPTCIIDVYNKPSM